MFIDDVQFSLASFNHNDFMKDELSIFDKSQNNNYDIKDNGGNNKKKLQKFKNNCYSLTKMNEKEKNKKEQKRGIFCCFSL